MHRSLPSLVALIPIVLVLTVFMFFFQVTEAEVAIVQTFGRIEKPQPQKMFELDAALASAFVNENPAPKNLLDAFAKKEIELSDQAFMLKVETDADVTWRLEDRKDVYVLEPTESGLQVSTLVSKDIITEAGPRFRWPWPIQSVRKFDDRLQTTITPLTETTTNDNKPIIISTAVEWRIADPYKFSIRFADVSDLNEELRTRVRNDQNSVIGNFNFADFVSEDATKLKYDDIEKAILAKVRVEARKNYGIDVRSTRIEKLSLPEVITKTVFNAMKKEREALAAQYTTQGESSAQQIKAKADGIAETIRGFALRKAAEIEAKGIEQAAKYNETFRQDPELAVFLMRMETLPDILADRTTILFDADSPLVNPFMEVGVAGSPTTNSVEAPKATDSPSVLLEPVN